MGALVRFLRFLFIWLSKVFDFIGIELLGYFSRIVQGFVRLVDFFLEFLGNYWLLGCWVFVVAWGWELYFFVFSFWVMQDVVWVCLILEGLMVGFFKGLVVVVLCLFVRRGQSICSCVQFCLVVGVGIIFYLCLFFRFRTCNLMGQGQVGEFTFMSFYF